MTLMFTIQPLSGAEMVSYYSLDIFRRANVQMNNYMLAIALQSAFTVGYIISAPLMTRIPRKVQVCCLSRFLF